jgi:hypothetical protein
VRVRKPRATVVAQEAHASARAVLHLEGRRERIVQDANPCTATRAAPECRRDLASGDVARMEHAPHAVRALPRECGLA